jgi:hypothetical protein
VAQKLSGGCACGAIHYECSADPVIMFNCHCRDCQQASGGAYAAIVVVPKTAVGIRGEPRYHKVVGRAGKAVERGFCPNCGSPVTMKLELYAVTLTKGRAIERPLDRCPITQFVPSREARVYDG